MTTFFTSADTDIIGRAVANLRNWLDHVPEPLNVALISGGVSAEDRLYIAESPTDQLSVTALTHTLTDLGARCARLDPCDSSFIATVAGFDVALSNLHGLYGEDGRLQGLLDWLRKPLCGSSVGACAVAADKILCKRFMTGLGIPTPPWQVWHPGKTANWRGRPVMVKPALGGSSIGMSLVRDAAALLPAAECAWATDRSAVLVEEFVDGLPVTIGLLELPGGVLILPPLSTVATGAEFYDAATKLDADGTADLSVERVELPAAVLDAVTFHARVLWDGLGCHGAVRVDFIVTTTGRVYALEVNTTPGMSRDSNFAAGARLCGLDLADIVRAMLHEALTRPGYDVPLPSPVFHPAPEAAKTAA